MKLDRAINTPCVNSFPESGVSYLKRPVWFLIHPPTCGFVIFDKYLVHSEKTK